MSGVQGKKGRNIDRLTVKESSVPSTGFKNVRALHEAAAGDTIIDISALTAPAEATANGYSAPTASDMQKVSLRQFKDNVMVKTGTGVLLQDIDYVITGAKTIKLSLEALQDQVFEITINAEPRSGNTLVDAAPLVQTGTLAADTTDFNVGEPFQVGKFPSKQIGSIMVFVDNQIAYRNVGNQPDGEGDYYEVHAGDGLGTLIRFNSTDSEDRGIVIASVGALVERPNGSQDAVIEGLAGQIDVIREILEDVIEDTIAPGAPNNVDLKAFGDRVLQNEEDIRTKADDFEYEWQTKTLTTDITVSENDRAELRFSNLTPGLSYMVVIFLKSRNILSSADTNILVSDGTFSFAAEFQTVPTSEPQSIPRLGATALFVASSAVMTTSILVGGGGEVETGSTVTLIEMPKHKPTTKFN